MDLNFSPMAWSSVVESTSRINIWEGAVRSGKTIASIVRWLIYIRSGPKGELLMMGRTERTLKRNILDVIEEMVGPENYTFAQGAGEVYIYGRRIYIGGANDERAEGKIRGMTLAGSYGDEITLWPASVFKQLMLRMSVLGACGFFTTNPDSPYHYLYTDYIQRNTICRSFHFTLEDNPNLPKAYIDALKEEYKGLWYKRFILGLWVMAEGAVYDMWDEDVNVFHGWHKQYKYYYISVDYGTTNPCTFGLYGHDDLVPKLGIPKKLRLVKEYYYDSKKHGRQKTDGEYADDFVNFMGTYDVDAVYVDPSAASFIAELESRGINVIHANNSVLDGIRFVAKLLTWRVYQVDEDCTDTRREFSAYVWDEKASLAGEDSPLKINDHAMDRDRYGMWTRFGKFINWSASWDSL